MALREATPLGPFLTVPAPSRSAGSEQFGLTGRADAIEISADATLTPVEYKIGAATVDHHRGRGPGLRTPRHQRIHRS
jgi:hypothetical protein